MKLTKQEAFVAIQKIRKETGFKTGNNPLMEVAEEFGVNYYGGKLLSSNNKGADIESPTRGLVQIKGRTVNGYYTTGERKLATQVKSSHLSWDVLAVIVYKEDGTFDSHWEISKECYIELKKHDEHDNIHTLPNTKTQWEKYERKDK